MAINLRVGFYGNADFGWPPFTETEIGMAMTLLGIVVVTLDTALAWLVAAFGVEMLFQAARDGNLYGSGGTYGIGVVVAIVLAVAWVALGLYFALRKSPRIR